MDEKLRHYLYKKALPDNVAKERAENEAKNAEIAKYAPMVEELLKLEKPPHGWDPERDEKFNAVLKEIIHELNHGRRSLAWLILDNNINIIESADYASVNKILRPENYEKRK